MSMLDRLEIEPDTAASSAVIWLHGLGADGTDFEPLVQEWGLADTLATRFILPHAPFRPVTLNAGMVMRAWYDIYELGLEKAEDATGIEQAHQQLLELIEQQRQLGIPSGRIVLAGFSQGGALALYTALRFEKPLAGVLALSSYLPLPETLQQEKRADPAHLQIRMDHGERDPVIPLRLAERSREVIQQAGFRVEFHRYNMPHSLCEPQMRSLRSWLVQCLG